MGSRDIAGMIFDIEEFALYDGPGIRSTVFFKGCPLNCIWCHNPEGISKKRELSVKTSLCDNCGRCREICHGGECDICGECVKACSKRNRRICGEIITAGALADKLKRNGEFFGDSDGEIKGGITVSGGEPLYQKTFLMALLRELNGIHRAIETTGYAPSSVFTEMLEHVELVMMDIKHANSAVHKRLTGVDNAPILANLQILKVSDTPFIIRIPLIPGINDSGENLRNTAALLQDCENLVGVELLPYNKFTGSKYKSFGKPYYPPFDEQQEPNADAECFMKLGIRCTVI